jgi:GNAT superfamily N-acetyltransferase
MLAGVLVSDAMNNATGVAQMETAIANAAERQTATLAQTKTAMPEIVVLDATQARAAQLMTFPAYRHLLNLRVQCRHQDEPDLRQIQPVALAAIAYDQVIAMALLELPTDAQGRPELLSLFVAKIARQRGVASWLLAACEQYLWRRGWRELITVYMTGKPGIEHFERILARRGWQPPEQRMLTVRFAFARLMQAEWISKYRPRPGYRLGAWADVSAAEMQALRMSNSATQWIAPDLVPWLHDAQGFEPHSSIAIYYRDAVVGWLINHRIDQETVRYTCSFIRPDLAKVGGILAGYVESFARSRTAGFNQGMFVTPLRHPAMMRFAERWFGPWASFVGQTRGSGKSLSEHSILASTR